MSEYTSNHWSYCTNTNKLNSTKTLDTETDVLEKRKKSDEIGEEISNFNDANINCDIIDQYSTVFQGMSLLFFSSGSMFHE